MPKITNHIKPVRTRFVKVLTHAISIGKAKSVAEIARQLKVNGSQLNRLVRVVENKEKSNECPTINMVLNFCELYNYSSNYVFTGRGNIEIDETELARLNRLEIAIKGISKIIGNVPNP